MMVKLTEKRLTVVLARTDADYGHLGKWVAQIKGLPQARAYGADEAEALGKLVLAFGKEHGIAFLPASELDPQRKD